MFRAVDRLYGARTAVGRGQTLVKVFTTKMATDEHPHIHLQNITDQIYQVCPREKPIYPDQLAYDAATAGIPDNEKWRETKVKLYNEPEPSLAKFKEITGEVARYNLSTPGRQDSGFLTTTEFE